MRESGYGSMVMSTREAKACLSLEMSIISQNSQPRRFDSESRIANYSKPAALRDSVDNCLCMCGLS
jgi:hypothetical protein